MFFFDWCCDADSVGHHLRSKIIRLLAPCIYLGWSFKENESNWCLHCHWREEVQYCHVNVPFVWRSDASIWWIKHDRSFQDHVPEQGKWVTLFLLTVYGRAKLWKQLQMCMWFRLQEQDQIWVLLLSTWRVQTKMTHKAVRLWRWTAHTTETPKVRAGWDLRYVVLAK